MRGHLYMQTNYCDAWDLFRYDEDDEDAGPGTIEDLDIGLDEGLYGFEIETTVG